MTATQILVLCPECGLTGTAPQIEAHWHDTLCMAAGFSLPASWRYTWRGQT